MISISHQLMSGSPNITLTTSLLHQKSVNFSSALIQMPAIKTALFQLLKATQAKAGKLKSLTRINTSEFKYLNHLLLSTPFSSKQFKETI